MKYFKIIKADSVRATRPPSSHAPSIHAPLAQQDQKPPMHNGSRIDLRCQTLDHSLTKSNQRQFQGKCRASEREYKGEREQAR